MIYLNFIYCFSIQVELARRLMMDWHAKMREQIFASRLLQCAKSGGSTAVNYMSTMQSSVLAQAGTLWGLVTVRAGRVQNIVLSTPAGPLVIACLGVTNEVGKKGKEMVRNGVDMLNAVFRGSKAMMKVSVLVADGVLRGTIKEVKNWSTVTLERIVKRGHVVVYGGVNVTKKAVRGTTQATLNTVAFVGNTAQTVVIGLVNMGGVVGKQGVDIVKSVWCANGRILLRILTSGQRYIPASQLLNLGSLFGMPCTEISAAVHHGSEQQQPETHQAKEQQQPEAAASPKTTKQWNPKISASKATPTASQHLQDAPTLAEVCLSFIFSVDLMLFYHLTTYHFIFHIIKGIFNHKYRKKKIGEETPHINMQHHTVLHEVVI